MKTQADLQKYIIRNVFGIKNSEDIATCGNGENEDILAEYELFYAEAVNASLTTFDHQENGEKVTKIWTLEEIPKEIFVGVCRIIAGRTGHLVGAEFNPATEMMAIDWLHQVCEKDSRHFQTEEDRERAVNF